MKIVLAIVVVLIVTAGCVAFFVQKHTDSQLDTSEDEVIETQGRIEVSGSYHYNVNEAREGAEIAAHLVASTVCITPDDNSVNDGGTFCLNMSEDTIKNFGIDLSTGCDKYYGDTTLEISDLEDFDSDGIFYADLEKILSVSESAKCAQ